MIRLFLATITLLALVLVGCGDDSSTSPRRTDVEAQFDVTPAAGTVITLFTFDAGSSTTTGETIEFRWDWESDGTWDTGWSGTAVATHRYSLYGGTGIDTLEVSLETRSGSVTDTTFREIVIDARHGHILETLVPEAPGMISFGNDGTHLWLADWGAPGTGRIYKVDPTTGDSLYSLPSPDHWPCGVTWDGAGLWVSGYLEVRKIDPVTGDILDSFSVIYSKRAGGLAWDGQAFYHSSSGNINGADGRIHKYAADGTDLGAFDSPHGDPNLRGLAFDGANLWVTVVNSDSLYVLDSDDGTILRAVYVQSLSGDVTVLGDYVWCRAGGPLAKIVP